MVDMPVKIWPSKIKSAKVISKKNAWEEVEGLVTCGRSDWPPSVETFKAHLTSFFIPTVILS